MRKMYAVAALLFCATFHVQAQIASSVGTYDFTKFIQRDQFAGVGTRFKRIAGAPDGSVYALGHYANTLDPNGIKLTSSTTNNYGTFLIKFDKTGIVVWKDTIGPKTFLDINGKVQKNQTLAVDLALDVNGNPVILTEAFYGEYLYNPTKNFANLLEYRLIRYDQASGARLKERAFRVAYALGNYLTYIYRIAIDKANNTYVALEANKKDLDLDGLPFASNNKNLIKLSPDFKGKWVKDIGTYSGTSDVVDMTTDDSSNVYFVSRLYGNSMAGVLVSKIDSAGTMRWQKNFDGINNNDMYHPVGITVIGNSIYASVYHKLAGLTIEGVMRRKPVVINGTTYHPTGTAIYKLHKTSGAFLDFDATLMQTVGTYGYRASQMAKQGNHLFLVGASETQDFTLGDFAYQNSASVLMAKDQVVLKIDTSFKLQTIANTFAHRFSNSLIAPTEEGKVAWAGEFAYPTGFYYTPGKIGSSTVSNFGANQDHLFLTVVTPVVAPKIRKPQTLTFPANADTSVSSFPFTTRLKATSSSGLPVTFSMISGNATISGDLLTVSSAGYIGIKASQEGNEDWLAASPVNQTYLSSIITSLDTDHLTELVRVSPNPSTGSITISAQDASIESIVLTDALGKQEIHGVSPSLQSNLKGLVLVQVKTNKGAYKQKLLIE